MPIPIPDDLILTAGRQFRYCNFAKMADPDSEGLYHRPLEAKTKDQCNLWSSKSRMDPTKHLPCFDVDMAPDRKILPTPAMIGGTVGWVVQHVFPGQEIKWVPSTTEGHFHVYIDHPYIWDDYMHRLRTLSCVCVSWDSLLYVVEKNYVRYSIKNGATHVRMPHIKKEYQAEAEAWRATGVNSPF